MNCLSISKGDLSMLTEYKFLLFPSKKIFPSNIFRYNSGYNLKSNSDQLTCCHFNKGRHQNLPLRATKCFSEMSVSCFCSMSQKAITTIC